MLDVGPRDHGASRFGQLATCTACLQGAGHLADRSENGDELPNDLEPDSSIAASRVSKGSSRFRDATQIKASNGSSFGAEPVGTGGQLASEYAVMMAYQPRCQRANAGWCCRQLR